MTSHFLKIIRFGSSRSVLSMDDRVFSTWFEFEHPPLHVDEPCNVLCYCSSFFETPACHADGNTKDEKFICILTSYSIPEHPSRPFLNQTVWEHSGGLAWSAYKESLRCNVQLVYWTYSGRLTSGKGYPALAHCVRPVIRSYLQWSDAIWPRTRADRSRTSGQDRIS